MEQQIRFCTTSDGVRIAYATVGEGPPLLWAYSGAQVTLYSRSGVMPEPRDRQPCPSCGELTLAFSPVVA